MAKNLETYYDRIQEKLRNTSFLEKVEKKQKSWKIQIHKQIINVEKKSVF